MLSISVRILALLGALLGGTSQAEQVSVGVASNLAAPMQQIAAAFARDTGHTATLVLGSSGKLYTQIRNGAPLQVLLSSDDAIAPRLEAAQLAVPGSRFTLAIGRLVLWSSHSGLVDAQGAVLRSGAFARIAMADPKLAPYGGATQQVLERLGLWAQLRDRVVQGESIGQTYQYVASGNAALGFVALSQVMVDGRMRAGSAWLVPASMHTPLRQDALLLRSGQGNPAAAALMAYLRGNAARAILRGYGYEMES